MKISEIILPANNKVTEDSEDQINQVSPVGSTPRKNTRAAKAKKKISDIAADLNKTTTR